MGLDRVHATIGRLTDPENGCPLPPPTAVEVDRGLRAIIIHVATPEHVERWIRHIGLTPAREYRGRYGTVEFWPHGTTGWCGAQVMSVTCPAPPDEQGQEVYPREADPAGESLPADVDGHSLGRSA